LSDECAYALSWDAANERFAAAGCITEEEANEFAKVVSSEKMGIEVRFYLKVNQCWTFERILSLILVF